MTFNWQGRSYDTSGMMHFETSNPASPLVYVAPGGEVFVVEIERMEGIEIRRAGSVESTALAGQLGFTHLLMHEVQKPTGADATLTEDHALLVEDDGTSRHALSRLLRRSGYDVTVAATVAEADAKLNERPKWVILDLQLPDGRGTTLLERIRSEQLPIKVAITTGETDEKVLSKLSHLKPDVIFHKPLDLTQVMQWLDAA